MIAQKPESKTGELPALYDRVGGAVAVMSLLKDFYDRVLADEELAPFFGGVSLEKLQRMQHQLFSAALGGPETYQGRSISHVHHRLKITLPDYQRFIRHLFDALAPFDMTDQERYEVIGRLNLFTTDVVSAGTGTIG